MIELYFICRSLDKGNKQTASSEIRESENLYFQRKPSRLYICIPSFLILALQSERPDI